MKSIDKSISMKKIEESEIREFNREPKRQSERNRLHQILRAVLAEWRPSATSSWQLFIV